jgi:hypothetical protein
MKRSRKATRPLSRKCRSYLSQKIAKNIKEGIYKSHKQAIAVAYSQMGKKYTSCQRSKKKKKRDGNRKILINMTLCDNTMKINRRNQNHLESIVFSRKFDDEFSTTDTFTTLTINKYKFNVISSKQIGMGTYSKVYKLYDAANQVKLALKIENNTFPSEKEISQKLMDAGCHTVSERYIGSLDGEHYYLMNLAEGTLEDFKDRTMNLPLKERAALYLSVVEEVRKQVMCLLDLGYVYSDFKLNNIFYDCPDDDGKSFNIYMGDLGSAIPNEENKHVATYPPPQINATLTGKDKGIFEINERNKRDVISWGIGIVLFMLIDDNEAADYLFNASEVSPEQHKRNIKRMNSFFGNNMGDFLEYEGYNRRNLRLVL